MVKALHRAGLEVILDVVFNHTAEGGHDGPTLSFRGLDNHAYYILEDGGARYADYSGCGNTLNANYPIVRRMIVDSLRYWVEEMHVDGFRFDLASILARDPSGQVLANPPVLLDIESDPALAGIKFMAEAWDASGLYQVGSFVGDAWKEWNGRFRDDVRAFFHGEDGMVGRFADCLVGSPELYAHKQREPEQSVNFVTCHDGFTLNDLVSYDRKPNKAWHGVTLDHADWSRGSHSLAFGAELKDERRLAHFIFNAYWEPLVFELPAVPSGKPWRRWIDTALDSPDDIAPWQQVPPIPGHSYRAEARSVVVLFADLG